MMSDFYEILGVSREATKDDITKAYRKLMLQYHPDKNPGDDAAEQKAKEISEAYNTLSDDSSRLRYDSRYGGGRGFPGTGFPGGGFPGGPINLDDLFSGGPRQRGPSKGQTIGVSHGIRLDEAVFGGEFSFDYRVPSPCACLTKCSQCGGTGRQQIRHPQMVMSVNCQSCGGRGQEADSGCESCGGEGQVMQERAAKVRIPPGTESGQRFGVSGGGHPGMNGGPPGDLVVRVVIKPPDNIQSLNEEQKQQVKDALSLLYRS